MKFDFSIPGYTLAKVCMGDAVIEDINDANVIRTLKSYWVLRIFTEDPIDDVNNSIILLCKEPYETDLILISLTSTFITNEMENYQVSFLDHLGNFRIPKTPIQNEKVKYEAIFFNWHPDNGVPLKNILEDIDTDFRSHGYTSYRPKDHPKDPSQNHYITMSLPKDAYSDNLYIENASYIENVGSSIVRCDLNPVVSFHQMNVHGQKSVNRFFYIDADPFLKKLDPIPTKEEEEPEEEICIKNKNIAGCYTIILWKKESESFTNFAFITKEGVIKVFHYEAGNTKVADSRRTVCIGMHGEGYNFILVSLLEEVDKDLGILAILEDAEEICDTIKSQNDLEDFQFYKWNPCIAKIYQYDDKEEDRFVAIYTEENEDE